MNTTSTYLAIENNLSHYQAMTAADPTVKASTAYFQANIGNVTSVTQLVSNYRLLSYVMNAYGLGDQVGNKALITKVLEGGTTSSSALANTLANPNWKKLAAAFNFTSTGSSAPTSAAALATTVADYQQTQTGLQATLNTANYEANIDSVSSVSQLLSNSGLLTYALDAYGLGDQVNNTALITSVLEGGTTSPTAPANTQTNPDWKKFAAAFNFNSNGTVSATSAASATTMVASYQEQQLEETQGAQDPGVQLALYFKREAATIKNGYNILGDENLMKVVQTAYNLPSTVSASQIDKEATTIEKLVPTSTLTDPTKLTQLIEKFTAAYDSKYGPSSTDPGGLTVADGNNTAVTPASQTILAGSISNTANLLSSDLPSSSFSAGLLYSLQGIKFGGL